MYKSSLICYVWDFPLFYYLFTTSSFSQLTWINFIIFIIIWLVICKFLCIKEAKISSLKEKLSTAVSNVIVNWKEKFHWVLFNFSIHMRYRERKILCNVCTHARCEIPLTIYSTKKIKKHCCGVFRYSKLLIQQSIDNSGVECAYRKEGNMVNI